MHSFEITVWPKSGDSWPVRVKQSAMGDFLPVSRQGDLQLDLEELRSQPDPESYGLVLGRALFRDPIGKAFQTALANADPRLHVLLGIEDRELGQLHWERLCAPFTDEDWDLMALREQVPFSLYLASDRVHRFPPIGREDLRALIVVAHPLEEDLAQAGLAPFDAQGTVDGLIQALPGIERVVLASTSGAQGPATLDELRQRLRDEHYSLLHLVAHGWVNETGDTVLYLTDREHRIDPVTGTELIKELNRRADLPHFVFLSACESAKPEAEAALGGLAQRLVREVGIPAVLAMTDRISVDTARVLAEEFYQQLYKHGLLDLALAKAYAGLGRRGDLTVPTLYNRLGVHPLFSDQLELTAPLSDEEIKRGLSTLQGLLDERAPVLRPALDEHTAKLQGLLDIPRNARSGAQEREVQLALAEISRLCGDALDFRFKALARGEAPPAYNSACPFMGLAAFQYRDREYFFGREALVNDLLSRLDGHRFLAVLGPSGCGKSSIVLAGLVPALEDTQRGLRWTTLSPGNNPVAALESAEREIGIGGDAGETQTEAGPRLLIVDQFEELFTLSPLEQRHPFLDRLLSLVERQEASLQVILTMRADFWGDCAPYGNLVAWMERRQKLIAPMSPAELRQAMETQARWVNLEFEAGLSHMLLDDVKGEPGAMPLLQHALLELWKRRHGKLLRMEEYEKIGGVQQAIAHTARQVYEQELSAEERAWVRDIFVRLTRLDEDAIRGEDRRDTRRRVRMQELVPVGKTVADTQGLVRRLADARLVVTSLNAETKEEEVEVTHEALIHYWPELRGWLDEDRASLRVREGVRQAMVDWENHAREDSYLLHRGSRLENARALLEHQTVTLNEREQAYLYACIELWERERIRRRREEKRLQTPIEAEIRVFAPGKPGEAFPVELNVPGWRNFPRGTLHLDPAGLGMAGSPAAYGTLLGQALFGEAAVGNAFQEARAAATERNLNLRLRLRLDPEELQAIHWERIHYPHGQNWQPVRTTATLPFSRYVSGQTTKRPAPLTRLPIRLLLVISSPVDLPRVHLDDSAAAEDQALHALLDELPDLQVTCLGSSTADRPTLKRVQQALAGGHDIVHLVCHSANSIGRGRTTVFLEGKGGRVDRVDTAQLVDCFRALRSPPLLCFLAAPGSAARSGPDPGTLSLARALVECGGCQAALALRDRLGASVASPFARDFYTSLLDQGAVDVAVNEACARMQDPWHWGVPVLYSQWADNQLLDR